MSARCLSGVADVDRQTARGKRFEVATVLVLMLAAKMAGEQTILGIAEWVHLRIDWLAQIVCLQAGPCANTYTNICAQIDAVIERQSCGLSWCLRLPDWKHTQRRIRKCIDAVLLPNWPLCTPEAATASPSPHLACNGKVLRGNHRGGADAQQVLGIFDVTAQYMLAQLSIVGKGMSRPLLPHGWRNSLRIVLMVVWSLPTYYTRMPFCYTCVLFFLQYVSATFVLQFDTVAVTISSLSKRLADVACRYHPPV